MADLPDKPLNREEQYLSSIAGENNAVPSCPASRKEAYLNAINGRVDGMEEDISELDQKVAALATDLSYKGGVADYAHLPANPAIGDVYTTEDDGILYVWDGTQWVALNDSGGGGGGDVIELTTDDYDYHASGQTDNTVALWRLPQGIYKTGEEVSVSPIASTTGRNARGGGYAIISDAWLSAGVNYKNIIFNARNGKAYMWTVNADDGSEVTSKAQLSDNEIVTENVVAKAYLVSYADARYIPTLGYIKGAFIMSKNGAPDADDLAKQGTLCVNYATATPELYVQTSASSPMNWVKVV